MGCLATPEPHLHLNFVALLEKAPRRSDPHLQVVVIRARTNPHLLDLRDVLVLLRVSGSLVLFEFEFPKIGDTTHRRFGRGGHLDQIQPGRFGEADGFLGGHDANLCPLGIEHTYLWYAYLTVGSRSGRGRWSSYEWWTRNRRSPS
jgi:hypothetical protein